MPRRSLFSLAVLVLGGGLLALLAIEMSLRLMYAPDDFSAIYPTGAPETLQVTSHPFLPFVGSPNQHFRRYMNEVGGFIGVDTNEYGFRTHAFPSSKQHDDLVVVCLGESTTWDYIAVSNEQTWPARLERLLQEHFPRRNVRVYNLGIEGGSAIYSLVVLGLIGVHLQPDLVIVYHGYNDYGPLTAHSYRWDYSHYYVDLDPDSLWRGYARNLPPLLQRSYAARFGATLVDRISGVNDLVAGQHTLGPSVGDVDAAALRLLPTLHAIAAIARGHGAAILFSTFQFRDPTSAQARSINAALRRFAAETDHPFLDQDERIPDSDPALQVDDCHFTAAGSDRLARNFFDAIVAFDLLGVPARR